MKKKSLFILLITPFLLNPLMLKAETGKKSSKTYSATDYGLRFNTQQVTEIMDVAKALNTKKTPSQAYFIIQVLKAYKIKNPADFIKTWVHSYVFKGGSSYNMRKALFNTQFTHPPKPSNPLYKLIIYYISLTQNAEGSKQDELIYWGWGKNIPVDWSTMLTNGSGLQEKQMSVYKSISAYTYKGQKGYPALDAYILSLT